MVFQDQAIVYLLLVLSSKKLPETSCPAIGKYIHARDSLTELPVSVDRCHLSVSMYLSINMLHSQVSFLVCRGGASLKTHPKSPEVTLCLPPCGAVFINATCLSPGGPFSRFRI